jgi:hypothetical protein
MSEATALVSAALVGEPVDLDTLLGAEDATLHGCAFQLVWCGEDGGSVNDEDWREGNLSTVFDMEKLKLDLLALRNLLLLTT